MARLEFSSKHSYHNGDTCDSQARTLAYFALMDHAISTRTPRYARTEVIDSCPSRPVVIVALFRALTAGFHKAILLPLLLVGSTSDAISSHRPP